MKTRLPLSCLTLAALVALPALTSEASEDRDRREAKTLFEAGVKLMKMEDFKAAAGNLERSATLFPTQSSLFNLANCYQALQQYGDALATLDRLHDEFGKVLKPELRKAAAQQQAELLALVGRLTVHVEPGDAQVSVDGKDVAGTAIRGPLVLAPGTHAVEVLASGYRTEQVTVQLVSGQERSLTVAMQVEAPPPTVANLVPNPQPPAAATVQTVSIAAPSEQTVTPESGSSALRVVAWFALGGAVAAGIAAGAFRLIADSHYSDFKKYDTGNAEDAPQRDAAKSDTQRANNLARGLGITAAAFALTAGVTHLLGREPSKPATDEPRVSLSPTGLLVAF